MAAGHAGMHAAARSGSPQPALDNQVDVCLAFAEGAGESAQLFHPFIAPFAAPTLALVACAAAFLERPRVDARGPGRLWVNRSIAAARGGTILYVSIRIALALLRLLPALFGREEVRLVARGRCH